MNRLGDGKRLRAVGVAVGMALAAGAIAPLAMAAAAAGPFGGGNSPIDISADELEVLDAESRAVWRGNVEAIQGANRLRAPVLNIFYAPRGSGGQAVPGGGGGEIRRMEAEGPVYYVTPQQNARSDHAVYEAGTNSILMTGNVVLVQDKNVVQGDRLTIDTRTNKATLVSTAKGLNKPGRVRGVFYPSQAQAAGAPGAAARP
jgi:lipopolysaccharide export system protein LptA